MNLYLRLHACMCTRRMTLYITTLKNLPRRGPGKVANEDPLVVVFGRLWLAVCLVSALFPLTHVKAKRHRTIRQHSLLSQGNRRVVLDEVVQECAELHETGRRDDDCGAVVSSDLGDPEVAAARVLAQVDEDALLFHLRTCTHICVHTHTHLQNATFPWSATRSAGRKKAAVAENLQRGTAQVQVLPVAAVAHARLLGSHHVDRPHCHSVVHHQCCRSRCLPRGDRLAPLRVGTGQSAGMRHVLDINPVRASGIGVACKLPRTHADRSRAP